MPARRARRGQFQARIQELRVNGPGARLAPMRPHRLETPPAPAAELDQDPLIATFLHRVGPKLAATFTAEQLAAVRLAFSARAIGRHAVDWRRTFRVLRRGYYGVFLVGRDAPGAGRRRERPPGLIAHAVMLIVLTGWLAGAILFIAALLYIAKTALGIDIFPGVDMMNDPAVDRIVR